MITEKKKYKFDKDIKSKKFEIVREHICADDYYACLRGSTPIVIHLKKSEKGFVLPESLSVICKKI